MEEIDMLNIKETRIAAQGIRSLVWEGDELVDWVGGARVFGMDGSSSDSAVRYAYPFDGAVTLPGSPFSVIYANTGTKGLLLKNGEVLRELNRSFYLANAYDYPVAVFRLPTGRPVLAHCPDNYNELQIEDLDTGEPLTRSAGRKAQDFFQSRLIASADGRYLVSAGWLWHPVDWVVVYDVEAALRDPTHLDTDGISIRAGAEESSVTFLAADRLAIAVFDEHEGIGDEGVPPGVTEIRSIDLSRPKEFSSTQIPGRVGQIVAVDEQHVLALHEHPRLIDLRDGRIVQSWPHIASGHRVSSISMNESPSPPMAFDPINGRYAFADEAGIVVLSVSAPGSSPQVGD
jgi:hypothetical protein